MASAPFADPVQATLDASIDRVNQARGLSAAPPQTPPTAVAPDFDGLSRRYDLPVNVLMALGEGGDQDLDGAARALRGGLNRGLDIGSALAEGLGDPARSSAVLERAYQIADDQFPVQRDVPSADVAPAKGGLLSDTGNLLWSGVNSAAENMQELIGRVPTVGPAIVAAVDRADRWMNGGKGTQEIFSDTRKSVEKSLSPEMLAATTKDWVTEGPDGYGFGPAWSDPRSYISGVVQSLPEMAVTMGVAGRLAKGAYAAALGRGMSQAAAGRAAATTATVAGGIMEGGLGGAASARSVRDKISGMSREDLASSDALKAMMADGMSFEDARSALAENAASQAFVTAGIATGIFGGMGDRALAKIITDGAGGGIVKSAVKGGVGEGILEEMPQSAGQQLAENAAMRQADPSQSLTEGVANQAVGGAVLGGLMGGGLGAIATSARPEPVARPVNAIGQNDVVAPADAPEAPVPPPEPIGPLERALNAGQQELDAAVRRNSPLKGQRVTLTDEFGAMSGTVADEGDFGILFRADDGQTFEYGRADLEGGAVKLAPVAVADTARADRAPDQAAPDEHDQFDERAGILEFDEGLTRAEAERVAREGPGAAASLMRDYGLTRADADYVLREQQKDVDAGRSPRRVEDILIDPEFDEDLPGVNFVPDREEVEPVATPAEPAPAPLAPALKEPVARQPVSAPAPYWDAAPEEMRVAIAKANGWGRAHSERMARLPFAELHPGAQKKIAGSIAQTGITYKPVPLDGEILPPARQAREGQSRRAPPIIEGEVVQADAAAHEAATSPRNDLPEPTQAQKEAGNYRLGHLKISGLDVSVENPEGSERKGVDRDGKPWSVRMKSHYGYIRGTIGKDKDRLDVFVRPGTTDLSEDAPVYVVNQIEPTTGRFDEHKILIGYRDRGQAERASRENYTKDWAGLGSIVRLTAPQFRAWLKDGDTKKPLALPAPKSTESDNGVRGRNERGEGPAPVVADGVGQPAGAPGNADRVALGAGADPGAAEARGRTHLPDQRPAADAKPALKAGPFREGRVGDKLSAGERVLTATGRPTAPFPKVDTSTDRRALNTLRRVDEWLMDNAADEAKARGDEMNERIFRTNRQKPSQADKDAAEAYLFDREFVQPRPEQIARPLGELGTSANTPPSSSWVIRNKETGEVVMETFDRKKIEALNTRKYEAVPIQSYLSGLGKVDQAPEDGVRAQRQKQRAQKAENLRARADALDARAESLRGVGGDDPALATPSSPGGAFGMVKERGRSAYLEAGRLSTESERLRSEAADLDRPARVRGDAERENSARADALHIAPGDTVDWMGREFEVLKVNAKTVTLKGARENMRAEKSLVRVVRKARAAEEPAAEKGSFGPIFTGYTNQPEAAIRKLMDEKRGEVADAFMHPELGPIAFVYGDEKMGLRHVEVKRSREYVDQIPTILRRGQVVRDDDGLKRAYVVTNDAPSKVATIRLDWNNANKIWLVTAFDDERMKFARQVRTSDVPPASASPRVPDATGQEESTTADSAPQSRDQSGANETSNASAEIDTHLRTGNLGSTIGRLINAGRVVIHDDASTLPGAGHPEGAIQGMTAADGTIHLVAANLTRETAPAVLLHETFHSGVRPLLGDVVWTRTLERVRVAAQAAMDRADASMRGPSDTFWEAALTSATVANTPLPHLSEEIAAYAIEHREQAPAGVRDMVDRLIGSVTAWLLRRFGVQAGRVTPAELRALAVAALKDWDADIGEVRVTGGFSTVSRIASTFAQAREAAKAFQGKPLKNAATGMEAIVSRNNLDKMLSGKAVSKSASSAAHALAVANVDQLFEKATLGWSKPDTHGDVNINAIHRFFAPIRTPDGRAMLAKLTVKEIADGSTRNPLYTVEAVEFNETNPAQEWVVAAAREDGLDVKYPLRGEWAAEIAGPKDPTLKQALYGFRVTKAETRAAGDVLNLAQEVENFNRNGEARYSMRMPSVPSKDRLFDRARQALTAAMVGAKGSDKDRGRFSALGLVPTRPLFLELAKDLKSAKTYIDLKMSMDTMRNEWHALAADSVQEWVKFARKNKAANDELMDIMHASTLAEVDPSKPFESLMTHGDWYQLRNFNPETEKYQALLEKEAEDKARKKVHTDLTRRFAALPAEAKTIFKTVRDHYRKLADGTEAQVLANVQEALQKIVKNAERTHEREMQRIVDEGLTGKAREDAIEAADRRLKYARARTSRNRAARLRSMRAEFESNRLKGAYFPLARFGHYFVTLRDDTGKVVSFSRFESLRKQEAFIAEMRKSEPSLKVEHGILDAKTNYSGMVDPKFVSEVEAILEGANAPEALRDEVWQAYLQSLPDLSTRKNRIHRKGTAGFEKDAIRAFAHQLFHGSHQLARLTYGLKLQDAIDEMGEQAQKARDPVRAKAVANEIKWRHDFIMNPSQAPWSHWMTSAAFVWTMGANLSSALVNIDQTFTKGIPWIAADKDLKPGVKRTTAAILQAMRDFTAGHGWTEKSTRLTADERAAMRAGYENGLIDRTQAHDVAGVAETGVAYSARRDRIMRFLSWPMHHTERFNREVTYLASYRLARQKGMGHGEAIKKASDLTWFTHFDNQNTSKPRFMQGDWGRVVFAMKAFQANILYRIFRDLHQAVQGESPEVQREARGRVAGTFIATLLAAGIRGSIAYGLVMTLASLVMGAMGDEDDPEEALRKWVLEHTGDTVIGQAVGGMMMDGIPGYLTGTSLSGRIGMADLWFRSNDRDLEGSDAFLNIVGNVLGVPFGLAQSVHGGYESITDGQVWRGAEQMSPAALRNVMKGVRYAWEGALNRRGAQIVEDVPIADVIKQAVGFTPAQIAEQSRANNFAYNMQTRIREEKSGLLDALWTARGDPDQRAKVMSDIQAFNARHPGARITPSGVNQSMRGRERYLNNAVGGANIDKGIRPEIEGKLAPSIY